MPLTWRDVASASQRERWVGCLGRLWGDCLFWVGSTVGLPRKVCIRPHPTGTSIPVPWPLTWTEAAWSLLVAHVIVHT